jgi:F-type H+-transporting ATPase subunit a
MEHHYNFITEILSLFGLGEFAHKYQHLTHSWLIMIIMIAGGLLLVRGIKPVPDKKQSFLEFVISSLEDFIVSIAGPEGKMFFPFIATIFLYILLCNLMGLIPGFFSPTADTNTTLALALATFFYTHYIGIKYHGIKYIKHFLGPVPAIAPIMLPIEIIGHLARVMSLTIRLFGNIFGKEKILGILFAIAGAYLAPLPVMVLGLLVSFVQALVFMLLATVYFAGAMEEAH